MALLPKELQVPQKPAEHALLLAGLLRIHHLCPGSLLLVFLPGREAGQGVLSHTLDQPLRSHCRQDDCVHNSVESFRFVSICCVCRLVLTPAGWMPIF